MRANNNNTRVLAEFILRLINLFIAREAAYFIKFPRGMNKRLHQHQTLRRANSDVAKSRNGIKSTEQESRTHHHHVSVKSKHFEPKVTTTISIKIEQLKMWVKMKLIKYLNFNKIVNLQINVMV